MPNVRELEDLIIDAIYQDILRGKLDQKEEQLEVEYTMGRDVEPSRVDELLRALQNWASTTSQVLQTLDSKISSIAADAASQKTIQAEYDKALQHTLKEVHDKSSKDGNKGGAGGSRRTAFGDIQERMGLGGHHGEGRGGGRAMEAMDVDEPMIEGRKLRKYVSLWKRRRDRRANGFISRVSQDSATKPLRKKNKF
jgi:COP9 signalosome complex subunit 7